MLRVVLRNTSSKVGGQWLGEAEEAGKDTGTVTSRAGIGHISNMTPGGETGGRSTSSSLSVSLELHGPRLVALRG